MGWLSRNDVGKAVGDLGGSPWYGLSKEIWKTWCIFIFGGKSSL